MESHSEFRPVVAIPFVLILVLFVLLKRVCSRLESHHVDTWQQLGRPVFPSFGLDAIRNGWTVSSVLLRRRYASLQDPTLRMIGDLCLLLYALVFACLVSFVMYPSLPDYGIVRSDTPAVHPLRTPAGTDGPPWYFFAAVALCAVIAITRHRAWGNVYRRLREGHPEVWDRLGRPSAFTRSGGFEGLKDEELNRLKGRADRINTLTYLTFGAYVVLFLYLGSVSR
jgi:hypothetical protein